MGTVVGVGVNVGVGTGVFVDVAVGIVVSVGVGDGITEAPHAERKNITRMADKKFFKLDLLCAFKIMCLEGSAQLRLNQPLDCYLIYRLYSRVYQETRKVWVMSL